MKKLLLFLVITAMGMFKGYSQALVQTYTDRCTGQVSVFTVPMNGSTVVAFYNRSKTFTSQEFSNGTLQAWLEETYLWWTALSPCSTNQAGTTATQQSTQQTTQQATQAATNAAQNTTNVTVNASPPPTNTPPTQNAPEVSAPTVEAPTTDTSVSTTDTGPNINTNESTPQTDTSGTTETRTGETGTTETSTEASTTETSESQTETQQTESTSDDSGGNDSQESKGEDSSSSQDENAGDSESTSEETQEETTSESEENQETEEQEVEESSEESSEEETTEEETTEEESSEEEASEEESESEDEESSEESEEESEEEKKKEKKKKKRSSSPPIISANIASLQNLDGTYNQAFTVGISQSSLMGTSTYGATFMVWDNLQQFMLNLNYSKVHINKKGRINRVYSASLGGVKMFTTYMGMTGHSMVFLGKKGSVTGISLGANIVAINSQKLEGSVYVDQLLLGSSLTSFYTKPFNFDRLIVTPMLAVSNPFMSFDMYEHTTTWNKNVMIIAGSNFDYKLTKRFNINFGINSVASTIPNFPIITNFTIGSRFSF